MPDLRLLIMEPSRLNSSTLRQLSQYGWGLCHAPIPNFLKKNTGDCENTLSIFGSDRSPRSQDVRPSVRASLHLELKREPKRELKRELKREFKRV